MRTLTQSDIRASFVNATKGETKRLTLPRTLVASPWDDLDFLGWRDPAAPQKAYLVAATSDTTATGIALRLASPTAGRPRRTMCALCLTVHPGEGVSLMTARKAGKGGQQGNSVGTYLCSDLACSLYLRGLRTVGPGARLPESLSVEDKADRLTLKLTDFLRAVSAP